MVEIKKKSRVYEEVRMFVLMTVAAAILAFNMNSFVQAGDLFPSGFSGLALLIQRFFDEYLSIQLPFSPLNTVLNIFPAYLGFRYIGKKFTIYSFYLVFLMGILTDLFPTFDITEDLLLIAIFGGIINGTAVAISLIAGASAGGVDFIAIFFSEKKGIDAWNYILAANVVILTVAAVLFGFEPAMYSIIFQYASTQLIQMLHKRYQKDTLLIITSQPMAVYGMIRKLTHHDATLIEGVGCYEGVTRNILYSVVGREEVDVVINAIHEIDPKAFINVIKTQQINGRFYKTPTK